MFISLLLESAKDELSFRTVVRDLHTKQPALQIVLLNPSSWCSSGYCSDTVEQVPKVNMYPTIKLLYSNASKSNEQESRLVNHSLCENQVLTSLWLLSIYSWTVDTWLDLCRMMEEWTTKNQADEVYMLTYQIKELIGLLKLEHNKLPPSHSLLHGFSLSSMRRWSCNGLFHCSWLSTFIFCFHVSYHWK